MTNPHAAVANRLTSAREAAGYSIDEVSTMMMSPREILARLEKGQFAPEPQQSEALARIYGVSIEFLLAGDRSAPALAPTAVTPLRTARG